MTLHDKFAAGNTRRRRFWLMIPLAVASGVLILLGLSAGAGAGSATPVPPSGWSLTFPVVLPSGYMAPTGLASESDGSLWVVAAGFTGSAHDDPTETIFH